MNDNKNQTDKKSLAYKMGYLLGAAIVGCCTILVIALTIKLIVLML